VLNVNDDPAARTYKSALLGAAGFDVVDAARGDEAIRLVGTAWPDFILLDVHLPDDNGIDICRRLQPADDAEDAFEGDRPFAIALISAHVTQPEDIARGMAAGADAYLVEPLDDGYLVGLVRALADRHIRRRAAAAERKALRERDFRYKVLQATVGDTIYDWDLATDTVEWSDASYRMLGYRALQVGERSQWWVDRIHPDDRGRVMVERHQAFDDQKIIFETEYRFRRADGSFAVVIERATIIYEADGRPLRAIGALSDVTERRQLAEQLRLAQKMEAVGLLAGGIAHDFNNVLTSVIGFTDLARIEPGVPSGITDHLDEIEQAARRGAGLVTQLLAFSRQQVLKNEALDLNDVIRDSTRMLDRLIGAHIRVSHEMSPGVAAVQADRTRIEQVLLNLVVNARDAMPEGGELQVSTAVVQVPRSIREARTVPRGRYVCLTVSDTGLGMDDQTRARIFEPFFTTKDRGRGTGLGLSTVYGIVRQSGGYITVHSSRGAGTTFEILLPALHAAAITTQMAAEPRRAGSSLGETVLLVEDESSVRRLTLQMLSKAGYLVLDAADGREALSIASDHQGPIHLLLADIVLPGLSGVAVADALRLTRPDIRVLYTSGYGDEGPPLPFDLDPALRLLAKPFTHDVLMREVRDALASDSGTAAVG
jgi:two-component system, cell cycle sensor histidine kinase and response regulator CckA